MEGADMDDDLQRALRISLEEEQAKQEALRNAAAGQAVAANPAGDKPEQKQ
jgi:hypothetical protein